MVHAAMNSIDFFKAILARAVRSSAPLATMLAVGALVALAPSRAEAFDYLEHSYFSDYACNRVQGMLAAQFREQPPTPELAARYIALGLFCPVEWKQTYCVEDAKQTLGHINLLEGDPEPGGKLSVTLGDYAALPDHFAHIGPIRNMPRAGEQGLWSWTAKWLAKDPGKGVRGVVANVAEDACQDDGLPPWKDLEQDIESYLTETSSLGKPRAIAEGMLSPLSRAPLTKGPADPAGLYSFNNPHYLDLVLRNHHHFGLQAYSSWLGFHSAGIEIAAGKCEQSLALPWRTLRKLARGIPEYEDVDWSELEDKNPDAFARKGCRVLSRRIEQRVKVWAENAPEELTAPVKVHLDRLLEDPVVTAARAKEGQEDGANAPIEIDPMEAIEVARLRDALAASVMALVFEGSSLHFLQDGLAAGHMRTIRTRGGLQEARYDHDRDNAEGVVAIMQTRSGRFPFVAFGDTYMLSPSLPGPRYCSFKDRPPEDPVHVSNCLISHQRGMLAAVSMASLLDWALGGTLYGVELAPTSEQPDVCASMPALERFICMHLPSRATRVAGEEEPEGRLDVMHHGSLPVPPPPYSYEALTTRIGFDVAGRAPQINVSFSLLSELDQLANWLTSYRLGVTASLGNGVEEQWFVDFAYSFHYRLAARVLFDGGASAYMGFRDFDTDATFFGGLSPVVGVTVLPEGWIKLPVELSLAFRFPINFFDSKAGFFQSPLLEGYWIYTGFGIAVMH